MPEPKKEKLIRVVMHTNKGIVDQIDQRIQEDYNTVCERVGPNYSSYIKPMKRGDWIEQTLHDIFYGESSDSAKAVDTRTDADENDSDEPTEDDK